jgi:DNA invertase Pin-like site-specific DNA recombinase
MKNMASCMGYARSASVDPMSPHRNSVAVQESSIARAVDRDGALGRLVGIATDAGCSGLDPHRPGLGKLLRAVRQGRIDTVVVTRIDRLTRSEAHFQDLLKEFNRRGVRLVSLDESLIAPARKRRKA